MDFEHSDKVKALQAKLGAFMDQHIYPNEKPRRRPKACRTCSCRSPIAAPG
jgi:hypothetical protein